MAWAILLIWCIVIAYIVIAYGISFDLQYQAARTASNNNMIAGEYDEPCWNKTLHLSQDGN